MSKYIYPSPMTVPVEEREPHMGKLWAVSIDGKRILGSGVCRFEVRDLMFPLVNGVDYYCYGVRGVNTR